jgi:hypothetical protein
MEITVNSCVPVDLVLLAVILVVDVFVVVPGREITVTNKPRHVRFKLTMLVVIGNDCTGSCKSNYHVIMTMTASEMFFLKKDNL